MVLSTRRANCVCETNLALKSSSTSTTTATLTTSTAPNATATSRRSNMPCCLSAPILLLFLTITLIVSTCHTYPSGAPESACKTLKPGHGADPSTSASPFELTQDKAQAEAGEQIKVSLNSPNKTTFKGLIVQALNEKGDPVGKFLAGKGLKTLDSCSAVTHSDREGKKTAMLVWEAPADMKTKETISFKATVVHKFDEFYMNIKSTHLYPLRISIHHGELLFSIVSQSRIYFNNNNTATRIAEFGSNHVLGALQLNHYNQAQGRDKINATPTQPTRVNKQ